MKHIPPASKPPVSKLRIPATSKLQTDNSLALPPVVVTENTNQQKMKHPFKADYDRYADKEFYKDFHFTYILLPVPRDDLPRKSCTRPTYKLPGVDIPF